MKTDLIAVFLLGAMAVSGCREREKAIVPVTASQLEGQGHLTEPASVFKTDLNLVAQFPGAADFTTKISFLGDGKAAVNRLQPC